MKSMFYLFEESQILLEALNQLALHKRPKRNILYFTEPGKDPTLLEK